MQVNARLTQESYDVLRALAFVDEVTEAELLRQAVDDFLAPRKADRDVQAALKALAHRRGRSAGTVSDLPERSSGAPPI
jgi:hypothetical protein